MIHKQAAINTAKILGSAVLATLAVAVAFTLLSVQTLMIIMGVGAAVFIVYNFYKFEKSRLESIDKLNEIR